MVCSIRGWKITSSPLFLQMIIKTHHILRKRLAQLIWERKYQIGAEIGVYKGEFSEKLLLRSGLHILYGIDTWENSAMTWKNLPEPSKVYQNCIDRLAKFNKRVRLIQGESTQVAKQFKQHSLDFIYLDADHSYNAVLADLQAWWDKVRPGGMFSGHDFYNRYSGKPKTLVKGVEKALGEFLPEDMVVHVTNEACASFFITKE